MSNDYPNPYPNDGGQPQYGRPQYGQQGPAGEPPLWAPWYGVSFFGAIKRFFKKYARFDGRASRSEFWWWYLANGIIGVIFSVILNVTAAGAAVTQEGSTSPEVNLSAGYYVVSVIFAIWGLAIFVPNLAILFRRLHDTNRSGWWWLIGFIPLVGPIILIVFAALQSQPEGTRFDHPNAY